MTVSSVTSRADYTGNGSTTGFAVPFYFLDNSHLTVLRTQISTGVITTLALTTDYTVSGAGVAAGGTVTCVTAPTTDQKLSILRNVPLTQLTHYVPNDPFPAASHEQALDQLTMEMQQVNEIAGRALQLPANTTGVSTSLPYPSSNKLIGWNSAATGLQNVDQSTLATIVAFGTANADKFSGTGSQTAFTLSANPGAQNNLDVSISGVTQRPGIDYTWTSGTTITFTTAPPSGTNNVLVRYMQGLPQGVSDWYALTNNPVLDVKRFGATGNGVTDDTAAIQTAINYAAQLGQRLLFPAGVYKITTLTIPVQLGGIEWVGESSDTSDQLKVSAYKGSVLVSTATSGNVISCDGGAAYSNRGIDIRNISIKAQTSGFVIYLKRAPDRPRLEYVTIYNSNSSGSGVCFDSCWVGALINSCNFRGEIGAANIGVKVFNDQKAGGFVMQNSSASGWFKGLEFGVWVYQATIRDTGLEANNYGAYIWQGDNNLTLDTCHFEFNLDSAIYIANCSGARITKCSFFRNAESAAGVKADIYVNGGASSYSYNTLVQNCYEFGLSSNTYFFYHVNSSYGYGVIDNNSIAILPGATGTKGIFLGGSGQQQWQVTNNDVQSTATPYTNCELTKQFSGALDATYSLRFAATQVPSSDANTLDDYEEGTWTPVLGGDGGNTGQSYTMQQGYYVKIGNRVYFTFAVQLSNAGSCSLEAVLKGLPFTIGSARGVGAAYVSDFASLGLSVVDLDLRTNEGSTQLYFRHATAAATGLTYPISWQIYTNTTFVHGGGWYAVA